MSSWSKRRTRRPRRAAAMAARRPRWTMGRYWTRTSPGTYSGAGGAGCCPRAVVSTDIARTIAALTHRFIYEASKIVAYCTGRSERAKGDQARVARPWSLRAILCPQDCVFEGAGLENVTREAIRHRLGALVQEVHAV